MSGSNTLPNPATAAIAQASSCPLPRVTIKFCTQCKWMLRAAYFAQELLSTFSLSLGEVALQPATGGIFTVTIIAAAAAAGAGPPTEKLLWDRKAEGGFPETKELKRRVRDVIDPGRDLGHVDRHGGPSKGTAETKKEEEKKKDEEDKGENGNAAGDGKGQEGCEDCK